jgi:hypothetical protein
VGVGMMWLSYKGCMVKSLRRVMIMVMIILIQ